MKCYMCKHDNDTTAAHFVCAACGMPQEAGYFTETVEESSETKSYLTCPKCGKECNSKAGQLAHMRFCK